MHFLTLLFLTTLSLFAMAAPSEAVISEAEVQQAAQVFCNALKAGKNSIAAQEAATDYLMDRIDPSEKVSPKVLRQRTRAAVWKQCPAQAQKLKESR